MARRSEQRGQKDSSRAKPISDMDPEGMDSEFEGDDELDSSDEGEATSLPGGRQRAQSGAATSQNKTTESQALSEGDEAEFDDEDEEEPTPRQPEHNRRESDKSRVSPSGDRKR